jgi:hypothetical protein
MNKETKKVLQHLIKQDYPTDVYGKCFKVAFYNAGLMGSKVLYKGAVNGVANFAKAEPELQDINFNNVDFTTITRILIKGE